MTAPDHFAKAELNIFRRRGPSTYDFCTYRAIATFGCVAPTQSPMIGELKHAPGEPKCLSGAGVGVEGSTIPVQ